MELSKTIENHCVNFEELFEFTSNNQEGVLSLSKIQLESFLSNKKQILKYESDNFIRLIFDETEENTELIISIESFKKKYAQLLLLIEENSLGDDIEIRDISRNNNFSINNENSKKTEKENDHSIIGKSQEKDQSEILSRKEISMDENRIDNSIDPNELFHDINFNDSATINTETYKISGEITEKPFSVVRPINTFNFETDFNNVSSIENKFNFKNNQHKKYINLDQINHNERITNPNEVHSSIVPQFINFQNNININVNNYGSLNNALSSSNNLNRNSINQKLQEVFYELNKSTDRHNTQTVPVNKYFIRKPTIKVEERTKTDNVIILNSNYSTNSKKIKEDYFLDFCKSVNIGSKINSNLKNISDRLLNLNRKQSNFSIEKKVINANTIRSTYPNNNLKDKINNYKFLTLEKMLKPVVNANETDLNSNRGSPNIKLVVRNSNNILNNNFDMLEEQLDSLYRKSQSSKTRNILPLTQTLEPKKSSRLIIDMLMKSRERVREKEEQELQDKIDTSQEYISTTNI